MGLIANLLRLAILSVFLAFATRMSQFWYLFAGCILSVIGLVAYRSNTDTDSPPPSPSVPAGKVRICVAGFTHSAPTAKAHYLADMIAQSHPEKYESWYYWTSSKPFYEFTAKKFDDTPFPPNLKGHSTSPFVWLEKWDGEKNEISPIGGSDLFGEWVVDEKVTSHQEILDFAKQGWSVTWYITGDSYHVGAGRPMATFKKGFGAPTK